MKTLIVLSSILLCISCSHSSRKGNKIQSEYQIESTYSNSDLFTVDFDQLIYKENIFISDYFSAVDIVELESHENSFIGKINKLIAYKDLLLILDRIHLKAVYIFDKQGTFLRKIGERGDGPGEYSEISDFTIDRINGIIYILDAQRQRIIWYDINNGEYINSIKIRDGSTKSFRLQWVDSTLYLDAYFPPGYRSDFALQSINIETGERISCWLDPVTYNKGYNDIYFTQQELFFSNTSESALINPLLSDTILQITPDKVQPYLVIKGHDILTTDDLKDETTKSLMNLYPALQSKDKIYNRQNYVEFGKYIYFMYSRKNAIYFLFYNKELQTSLSTNKFIDDLVFTKDQIPPMLPDLFYSDSTHVYHVIQSYKFEQLNELIKNGRINDTFVHKLKNNRLDEDSNPLILKYTIKDYK